MEDGWECKTMDKDYDEDWSEWERGREHRPWTITDLQNNIVNAERRGKRQVMIRPSSKVVVKVLSVMQKHGKSTFHSNPHLPPTTPGE